MTPLIELRNVSKDFRGVLAVENVDFAVNPGEIHAILGENGAGKSTLTKILAGVHQPSAGEMRIEGRPISLTSPSDALNRGIAMVFQETNLVPAMTVAQNIYLGDEKLFNRLRGINIQAQRYLLSLNFYVDPSVQVSALGAGKKQMVEIARAVHHHARLIIFDEPTATLTPEEKFHFFNLVRRLKDDGIAIIFISHALEEALHLSERITVMRDGKIVATGETAGFDRERIVQAMVGRSLSAGLHDQGSRRARPMGRRVLSVENLSMGSTVRNTSFSVFAGQVTGMFGLVGAGRTEMMKIVAGVLKRDYFHGGTVRFEGSPVRYRTPRPAVRDGIVYVTEDRKIEGFFETMTVAANIQLGKLATSSNPFSAVTPEQARRLAKEWTTRLGVKSIGADPQVITLSGGNQQKVVLSKALIQNPKLVILDEPTRGVDVGTIVEIHNFINELADNGMAVVVISSYLPEILSLSDRILVARQGRIVEEMDIAEATENRIMYAAVH
ncbi:sugar ABC transporter ATP-binding protein [Labrys wisconsinensis]|uniref:Simple sugar transport system ATP-binding protein/ribose transport system ATP-binding protein n=1 Tax=Labrys wisconsinensis TaxID=425677 RepID=A0ABU0JJC4_9HYPH|nr:sugar ABC transporter ATP-binding protein [Labrys wisconsinensis]MDQ0473237.1 simple sugar transport system ATP-binding protein/ribose transport system ATP-binding protein [Labrys wisconsinensis]